jgi:hypothetical protein
MPVPVGTKFGPYEILAPLGKGRRSVVGSLRRGGALTPVTEMAQGEITHRWPQILPGGKAVLFTAHHDFASGFDGANIEVMSLADHRRKTLVQSGAESHPWMYLKGPTAMWDLFICADLTSTRCLISGGVFTQLDVFVSNSPSLCARTFEEEVKCDAVDDERILPAVQN